MRSPFARAGTSPNIREPLGCWFGAAPRTPRTGRLGALGIYRPRDEMPESLAFGWLKKLGPNPKSPPASGNDPDSQHLSLNTPTIEACSDVPTLVEGVADDFAAMKAAAGADGAVNNADVEESKPEGQSDILRVHRLDLTSRLDRVKTLLYEERSASTQAASTTGTINLNWSPTMAVSTFKAFTADDLIRSLLQNLSILPFEARKSISAIFNYLLVCGLEGLDARQYASVSTAFASYVHSNATLIIGHLVKAHYCKSTSKGGDGCVDITLLCGSMLRSSLRHANIYTWITNDENCERLVYPFLDGYVHNPNFDVCSDALETVRVLLTGSATTMTTPETAETEEYRNRMDAIASDFLNRKYDDIIGERINKKCLSTKASYITRRMSLQLLSTILLKRTNYNVMMLYITSADNLVTILCLLRDPSPHISMDSFQVFKIFVANPNKPPEVVKILHDNKTKLVAYLDGLHKEREKSDEQFRDEKGLIVSTLEALQIEGT